MSSEGVNVRVRAEENVRVRAEENEICKKGKYLCDVCNITFTRNYNLYRHKQSGKCMKNYKNYENEKYETNRLLSCYYLNEIQEDPTRTLFKYLFDLKNRFTMYFRNVE